MDAKNKIYKVDVQSRSATQIGDLNLERGALRVHEEPAAICAGPDGNVRVFWRQAAGLWLCTVGEGVKKERRNLRYIWADALEGDS
jgi:hypothetical protein